MFQTLMWKIFVFFFCRKIHGLESFIYKQRSERVEMYVCVRQRKNADSSISFCSHTRSKNDFGALLEVFHNLLSISISIEMFVDAVGKLHIKKTWRFECFIFRHYLRHTFHISYR